MRLCIIGNSHIASLQSGWQRIAAEFDGVEPVFFGAPVRMMLDLRHKGRKLVAKSDKLADQLRATSGGLSKIDGSYDAYVLYGFALSPKLLEAFCEKFRSIDYTADSRRLLSRACHHEAVCALMDEGLAVKMLRLVREITRAPVVLLAAPMQSEDDDAAFAAIIANGDGHALAASFLGGCRDVARRHGVRFVAQPDGTLGRSPLTSRRDFSIGSEKLRGPTRENDYIHMNGDYGAQMLRAVLASLRQA